VAIVHGARDPETRKVEQQILFVVYSRAEAREAIGRGSPGAAEGLQALLARRYPGIRFDWNKLRKGIEEHLEVLPETYKPADSLAPERFQSAMSAFVRELVGCEPYLYPAAIQILKDLRANLGALRDIIDWRLEMPLDRLRPPRDEFHWHFFLGGEDVPPQVREHAQDFFERGESDKARAWANLLLGAFPKFADGYNLLGLVDLDRGKPEEAIPWFERTVQIGRSLFPKRLAKSKYWMDLETRPYVRGLRNLSLAFTRAGRYADALAVCDRLEKECGDDFTAVSQRGAVYLNLGRWEDAARESLALQATVPSESFILAFALYEQGRHRESLTTFLHAALNHPSAARTLVGVPSRGADTSREYEDLRVAYDLQDCLGGYMTKHFPRSRNFFRRIVRHAEVAKLLGRVLNLRRRWSKDPQPDRSLVRELHRMGEVEFARAESSKLATALGIS
jgi:tetratricopeptide (TPR) repeat protein